MKTRKGRAWKRWLAGLAGVLILAYVLAGIFALPYLFRERVLPALEEGFGGAVAAGTVRFNPLTFELSIEALSVTDPAEAWHLGARRVRLRGGPGLFFGERVHLRSLVLEQPRLDWSLAGEAVLPAPPAAPSGAPPAAAPSGDTRAEAARDMPEFSIGRFSVVDGMLHFQARRNGLPFERRVERLSFTIRDFRSDASGWNRYAFSAETAAGESLSVSGSLQARPPGARGELRISGGRLQDYAGWFRDELNVEVVHGIVELRFAYRFEPLDPASGVSLTGGFLRLEDFVLRPFNEDAPFLTLEALELSGLEIDLTARRVRVGGLSARGGQHLLNRDGEGRLSWARHFSPRAGGEMARALAGHAAAPFAKAAVARFFEGFPRGWDIRVGPVDLSGQTIFWNDAFPDHPVSLRVEAIELQADGWSNGNEGATGFRATARTAKTGGLDLRGNYGNESGRLDLALGFDRIPVEILSAYFPDPGGLNFSGGRLSGRLEASATRDGGHWADPQVAGELRASDLLASRAGDSEPAFSCDLFFLKEIEWTPGAVRAVSTGPVLLQSPRIALLRKPEYAALRFRLQRLFSLARTYGVHVAALELVDGRLSFDDGAAALRSVGAAGTVAPLDFSGEDASVFAVDLGLSEAAGDLVHLEGRARLGDSAVRTELAVDAEELSLALFDPFISSLLGRRILGGRMVLEGDYDLDGERVSGDSRIRISGLRLGDPTGEGAGSPLASALPFLTDRSGSVDLVLPLRGVMVDDAASIKASLRATLESRLGTVLADPLAALEEALPGGPVRLPEAIPFSPGSAEFEEGVEAGLAQLAAALAERPLVRLDLVPTVDAEADTAILKEKMWIRMLLAAFEATGDQDAAIRKLYEAAFPEEVRVRRRGPGFLRIFGFFAQEPPPEKTTEAMREAVIGALPVGPPQLAELARLRAAAVKEAVLRNPAVAPAQVRIRGLDEASNINAGVRVEAVGAI